MIVRPYARFESSLPEDVIEDEDGLFVQPPGKSVTDAIGEILRELDCDIYYGPGPVLDMAWEYGIETGGKSFRVGVNLVEDYWFFIVNLSWVDKFLRRSSPVHIDLLRRFARRLEADPRFSNVRWYLNRDEADTPGAGAPVEEGRAPRQRRRR